MEEKTRAAFLLIYNNVGDKCTATTKMKDGIEIEIPVIASYCFRNSTLFLRAH